MDDVNPLLVEELMHQARRQRAEVMYAMLLAPLVRRFARLRPARLLESGACSKTASSRASASSSQVAEPA